MKSDSLATLRWLFRLSSALWLGLWAFGLGGCASTVYEVRVSGLSRGDGAKPTSFRLVPYTGTAADKSPSRDTAVELVQRALTNKGFRAAPAGTTPDLFIVINCGLTQGAMHLQTTGIPIYVMVPGPIRQEQVQVGTDRNGTPIYQTVTVRDPPVEQIAGYDYQTSQVAAQKKYLRVFAFDHDPLGGMKDRTLEQAMVWAVQAVFESDDNNLRKVLPVLTAASLVFMGKATNGQVPIRINESDRDVTALR